MLDILSLSLVFNLSFKSQSFHIGHFFWVEFLHLGLLCRCYMTQICLRHETLSSLDGKDVDFSKALFLGKKFLPQAGFEPQTSHWSWTAVVPLKFPIPDFGIVSLIYVTFNSASKNCKILMTKEHLEKLWYFFWVSVRQEPEFLVVAVGDSSRWRSFVRRGVEG